MPAKVQEQKVTLLPKPSYKFGYKFKRFMRNMFIAAYCSPTTYVDNTYGVRHAYVMALMDLEIARINKQPEDDLLQKVADARSDFEAWLDMIPFDESRTRFSRRNFMATLERTYPFREHEINVGVEPI